MPHPSIAGEVAGQAWMMMHARSWIAFWPAVSPTACTNFKPIIRKSRADILHDTEMNVFTCLHIIQGLCKTCCLRPHRHNQELEEDSAAMEQERLQLQQQAESLAQRLEAVLSDKFVARTAFDADTPIDKTLAFLQDVIKVSPLARYQDDCEFRRSLLIS